MRTTYATPIRRTPVTTSFVRDDHGHVWLVVRAPAYTRMVDVTGEAWAEDRCPPRTPEEA